jgi:Tannase and feruloyl esterase
MKTIRKAAVSAAIVLLLATGPVPAAGSVARDAVPTREQCEGLGARIAGHWPDASTRITETHYYDSPQALRLPLPGGAAVEITVPAHCEILGVLHERVGAFGQHYAIRFHVRLPASWNQRFFFQGGGGTNGDIGNALGVLGIDVAPALAQGYAVVSQDSGHDNATNRDVARGGLTAFGFDAQARADYGHASLLPVSQAAKALIAAYYGEKPRFSYFAGCSKGGAEGMAAAQHYPEEFNGVLASAPGFSLPRAAVAQAWDVQSLAGATELTTPSSLAHAFSDADLALASRAVLAACDADDGLADGIVGAFEQCSRKKVHPELSRLQCSRDKTTDCLSAAQIAALERVYAGPVDARGRALYADWPWDAGLASPGWRFWKLGSADGAMPALNITLGGASLASVFTTPPTLLRDDPEAQLDFVRHFDFGRDASKIYVTSAQFPRSAWDDIAARSSDLAGFKSRAGKMLVPHGVSDPVFSINDTLAWYREVDRRTRGAAARFVRVFPVPGMAHCGGGLATDRYDAFGALVSWVERGTPPDRIIARAAPGTPWPGRERPLCPYPKVARYRGTGSREVADSFVCR